MPKRLDTVGWFIVNLHQMLGHRSAARYLGQQIGDMNACILCQYDRCEVTRDQVIEQIGV